MRVRGLIAVAVVVTACLAIPGTALAGQDPVYGGSVQIQLQRLRGLRISTTSLSMGITGGQVDPIDGSGFVQVIGPFSARRGSNKSSVTITRLTFGPDGAPGSIAAKVGRTKVPRFGTLTGGTVTRAGWGAQIENVKATLARNGARALIKALVPDQGNGAKSASTRGIRSGQALGTVSATTVPQTVEVVPGSGTMTLTTPLTFGLKLDAHCVDALSGGAAAVAPATQSLTTFTFPVSGGSLSPMFIDGKIQTSGGQVITKNNGLAVPILYPSCTSADPPVGTSILQNDFAADFGIQGLTAHAFPPGVDLGVAELGSFDTSGASIVLDPVTKQVTITNIRIYLTSVAADLLNNLFPNQGAASNDFSTNDDLGVMNVTAKLR
jgi:hypothetical protein